MRIYKRQGLGIALSAIRSGVQAAGEDFQISPQLVCYYLRKHHYGMHAGRWGGQHWSVYSNEEWRCVQRIVARLLIRRPETTWRELFVRAQRHCARALLPRLTVYQYGKIFQEWGWSWKIPTITQRLKFEASNLEYYQEYFSWRIEQDDSKIVYLDESHFSARSKSNALMLKLTIHRK